MLEQIREHLYNVLEGATESRDKHERDRHRQLGEQVTAAFDLLDQLDDHLTRIELMRRTEAPVRQRETQEYPL
jgi:hypothetical protein